MNSDDLSADQHEAFEIRLNEMLDQRLPLDSDPELLAAARQSPQLQQLLASYSLLLEGVQRLPRPVPSDDLGERIFSELNRPSILRMSRRSAAVLFAVAAALLIAATPVLLSRLNPASPAVQQITQADPDPTPIAQSSPEPAQPEEVPQDGGAMGEMIVLAMLQPQLDQVLEREMAVSTDAPAEMSVALERPSADVLSGVSNGLAPLARSTSSALDFLMHALSGRGS